MADAAAQALYDETYENYRDYVNPPLARVMKLSGSPVAVSASGVTVVDHTGKSYLDFAGGYGVFTLGHRHPRVVAIGETGLDYYYEHSPREAQVKAFRAHIAAARAAQLPLIVHTRDADDETGAILAEEMAAGPFTGLLHCFSSGRALAERAVGLGLYISLSGIMTFKKSDALRAIAAGVPADRLLVETDAPYLAPVPMRGKRNEPAFVAHTAASLAQVKGMAADELAEATTANFLRLFTKVKPADAA